MTISIEKLNERKTQLAEDFNTVLQDLQPAETEAKGKTNSGSDKKAEKEKGMPAAKQEALNIATS